MELVLTAILGALTKLSDTAVRDAYEGLKGMIRRKFGGDSAIADAVDGVEKKPDSEARKGLLKEELADGEVDRHPDLLAAAKALIDAVQALPDGKATIQNIRVSQHIQGDRNVVSATGDIHIGTDPGPD
jgi:hypothetical protein